MALCRIETGAVDQKRYESGTEGGVAMLMRAGLTSCVRHVRNYMEEKTNGVIQSMTIQLQNRVRVTGAYLSPTISGPAMEKVL